MTKLRTILIALLAIFVVTDPAIAQGLARPIDFQSLNRNNRFSRKRHPHPKHGVVKTSQNIPSGIVPPIVERPEANYFATETKLTPSNSGMYSNLRGIRNQPGR
jgi:hypothetical protein